MVALPASCYNDAGCNTARRACTNRADGHIGINADGPREHNARCCRVLAASLVASRMGARMIVRIWHGRTPRGVADEYAAFLARRPLADCRAVHGNLAAVVCRR